MLAQVKLLLGIDALNTDEDALLKYLIAACSDDAVEYCRMPEFDDKLERIVVQMVVVRYNLNGTEGVTQQSFSGVSESFSDGYPLDILSSLKRFRKISMV